MSEQQQVVYYLLDKADVTAVNGPDADNLVWAVSHRPGERSWMLNMGSPGSTAADAALAWRSDQTADGAVGMAQPNVLGSAAQGQA